MPSPIHRFDKVNHFVREKKNWTYVRMIRDVTLGFFECEAETGVLLLSCVGSVVTMDGDSGICDSEPSTWS